MNLAEIVQGFRPVYPAPNSWKTTVQHLLNTPEEATKMRELSEELEQFGEFRQPITLGMIHLDGEMVPGVTDGTHRVCAHILANTTGHIHTSLISEELSFPLTDEELEIPLDVEDEYEVSEYLRTVLVYAPPLAEEEWDIMLTLVHSVRCADGEWFTTSGLSGSEKGEEIIWDAPSDHDYLCDVCGVVPHLEEGLPRKRNNVGLHARIMDLLREHGQRLPVELNTTYIIL